MKSILLEVDGFLVRRISFSLASIFRKKKKEKTFQGKGRGFEFFGKIPLMRSSRKPSVKPSLSSKSSLQKVLEYRRRRPSIQTGSTAFASIHDELSADKKSRVIRAGLPWGHLDRTSSKTARNCKKQGIWSSSVSAWHLHRGPWASTEDVDTLPLSLSFTFSFRRSPSFAACGTQSSAVVIFHQHLRARCQHQNPYFSTGTPTFYLSTGRSPPPRMSARFRPMHGRPGSSLTALEHTPCSC